ncbi:hypothetical protein TA3x_001252 [Tundrisphaera sp. TA3]|uniref:hypothetical protein n=1 Tax=Tundrisphaera sp. TA3 TaxID=3435775 RepID=UPI003EBC2C6E
MGRRLWNVAGIGLIAWCSGAGSLQAAGLYHVTNLGTTRGTKLNDAGQVIATEWDGSIPVFGPDGATVDSRHVATRYTGYGPDAGKVERFGDSAAAVGLNNAGQTVLWENGALSLTDGRTSIPIGPGRAVAVNDSGQVLGNDFIAPDGTRASSAIWQAGRVTPLAAMANAAGSDVMAINNAGQALGYSYFADGMVRSHLWDQGVIRDVGSLGGRTYANGLNESGVVVGGSEVYRNQFHAFVSRNGVMTDLGILPGGGNSYAIAIGDAGDIVGTAAIKDFGPMHGFLFRDGRMIDLNTLIAEDLGLTITSAIDINASGQILGFATDRKTGLFNTVLLTPDGQPIPADRIITPEPSSMALAALILAAAGAHRARARRRA